MGELKCQTPRTVGCPLSRSVRKSGTCYIAAFCRCKGSIWEGSDPSSGEKWKKGLERLQQSYPNTVSTISLVICACI